MTTTINPHSTTQQVSVESLASAISLLSFKDKERLLDMIEQQVFEGEEENCEEREASLTETEAARTAYNAGEHITFDEYLASHSLQS